MPVSSPPKMRILIGASSFADAIAALQILGRLTVDVGATLGGLLIEESEALALCHIPNQRVISPSGALAIAPSPTQLRTMIEADAKAFRRSLAQISDPVGARWTFEQSMGDLVQTLLQASQNWDIIIIGHRSIHPVGGKIALLTSSTSEEDALISFSAKLAQRLSAERIIFSVGQIAGKVTNQLALPTLQRALAELAKTNAQAVLVDLANGPICNATELRQLLEVARCPVFVFGANLSQPQLDHSTHTPPAPDTESGRNDI